MLRIEKDVVDAAITNAKEGDEAVKYDDLPAVLKPVLVRDDWDSLAKRVHQKNRLTLPEDVITKAAMIKITAEAEEAEEAGEGNRRKFFEKLFTKEQWDALESYQELMLQRYTKKFKEHVRVQRVCFFGVLASLFLFCLRTSRRNSGSLFAAKDKSGSSNMHRIRHSFVSCGEIGRCRRWIHYVLVDDVVLASWRYHRRRRHRSTRGPVDHCLSQFLVLKVEVCPKLSPASCCGSLKMLAPQV